MKGIIRAPTAGESGVEFVAKSNFAETFGRVLFIGSIQSPMLDRYKRRKVDARTKKVVMESHPVGDNGTPDYAFLKFHNLSTNSKPHEWFEAFLPSSVTGEWASHTNLKAMLSNSGNDGEIYPNWKPFGPAELRKHIAVYFVQGLSPSQTIDMKFKSQGDNDINGNDFITRCLGPNAVRRHKHFWRFFAVQDPKLFTPPNRDRPNFKIDPFLDHIKKVSMGAWCLGKMISVEEQTIGFQSRNAMKLRITYRREGDGFQCDALCDSGYTQKNSYAMKFHQKIHRSRIIPPPC